MYYMVEVAGVLCEIVLAEFFLRSIFLRKQSRWIYLAYLLFSVGLTILSLIPDIPFWRLGYAFTGVFAVSVLFYRAKPLWAVFAGAVYCVIIMLTDLLVTGILLALKMDFQALMQYGVAREIYGIFEHLVLIPVFGLVCWIWRRGKTSYLSPRVLLPVLPCILASALLGGLLCWQCYQTGGEISSYYVIVMLGLLYTCLILIAITNRMNRQEAERQEEKLAEHHYMLQKEYYETLHTQQEETRALWHDIGKYLRAMQALTDDSRAEEAKNVMRQAQSMIDEISPAVDVNNRVVNVILTEYVREARDAKTAFELDVQVPPELFVAAADLYVLIGNTVDNALNACCLLPEEKRKISIKLRVQNDVLFYSIKNPFSKTEGNAGKSTVHGYGLKNVRRCVEKYKGGMEVFRENDIFTVSIHMNGI